MNAIISHLDLVESKATRQLRQQIWRLKVGLIFSFLLVLSLCSAHEPSGDLSHVAVYVHTGPSFLSQQALDDEGEVIASTQRHLVWVRAEQGDPPKWRLALWLPCSKRACTPTRTPHLDPFDSAPRRCPALASRRQGMVLRNVHFVGPKVALTGT